MLVKFEEIIRESFSTFCLSIDNVEKYSQHRFDIFYVLKAVFPEGGNIVFLRIDAMKSEKYTLYFFRVLGEETMLKIDKRAFQKCPRNIKKTIQWFINQINQKNKIKEKRITEFEINY